MDKLKGFATKKGRLPLIIGVTVGIILLLIGSASTNRNKNTDNDEGSVNSSEAVKLYTELLEEKIEKLCLSVEGISEVKVLLTLDRGSEGVYAQNTKEDISDTLYSGNGDYLIIGENENGKPLLLYEIYPKIRGVAVVCTGGETATVCKTVTELLSAALGISSNRIKVAGC